jgi:hypothetical protein
VCVAAGGNCDSFDTSSTTTKSVCDVTTAATGTCKAGTATCGGLGQACCVSNYYSTSTSYYYCGASGSRCLTSSATGTTQYLCQACGGNGQPCCVSSTTTGGACTAPYQCTYGSSTYTCTPPTATATSTSTAIGG